MREVKKVEAYDLISDMRGFAFDESRGFASGMQNGYEVQKSFYHVDPVPEILVGKNVITPEMCKSTFGFTAFRLRSIRNKPGYTFSLHAALDRTLTHMPAYLQQSLSAEVLDNFDGFETVEEGALSEKSTIELETSTYELGSITVSHSYEISYADEEVYKVSDDDIIYGVSGEYANISPLESIDESTKMFIPEAIAEDRIDDPSIQVLANLGFWAIVDPYNIQQPVQITPYRDAAERMRAIVHALRTGDVPY